MSFEEGVITDLKERTCALAEELGEKWDLRLSRVSDHAIQFEFSWESEGIPEVDGTSAYLARNYDCICSSVPGLVKCGSVEEAERFLDLVQAHCGPDTFPGYEKVTEAYMEVQRDGLRSAVGSYVDEWCLEEGFPAKCDGSPYWIEELGVFDGADLVTTVGPSTVYGSYHDIPVPEQESAILVRVLSEWVGGEAEVELHWIFETVGLTDLEDFLALQLLCHSDQDEYAYVRVDLMGGVWLLPTVDNLEFLDLAQEQQGFLDYYNEHEYRHGQGWVDERIEAVEAFRESAQTGNGLEEV